MVFVRGMKSPSADIIELLFWFGDCESATKIGNGIDWFLNAGLSRIKCIADN